MFALKNIFKAILLLAAFFAFVVPAQAKSYSIDQARIRYWIQPNGDLVVNELYSYTVDGSFKNVTRTFSKKYNKGIDHFFAYEVSKPNAKIYNIEDKDLHPLQVNVKGYTFKSDTQAKSGKKTIFYYYVLKGAVKSYHSYSDLTVPIFGKGGSHDTDINNITIDFIFPDLVNPYEYYPFIHDGLGKTVNQQFGGVTLKTPVSKRHTLTEARLLFPSIVMAKQKKTKAPISLKEAIAQEKQLIKTAAAKKEQQKTYGNFLYLAAAVLGLACLAILFRRLTQSKAASHPSEWLMSDPLLMDMVDCRGKKNSNSLLAGLYSLVEKGKAEVRAIQMKTRFENEHHTPNEMLYFSLKVPESSLSPSEQKLVSWLFRCKDQNGNLSFFMSDIAEATKRDKTTERQLFKADEKEWFSSVLSEMKEAGILSDKRIRLRARTLMPAVVPAVIYAYSLDSVTLFWTIFYATLAGTLLVLGWLKPQQRWRVVLFFTVSLTATFLLTDAHIIRGLASPIILSCLLYCLTPRLTLTEKAASIKATIREFTKHIKREGIPETALYRELEKWMVRSLLLKGKKQPKRYMKAIHFDTATAASAPLSYLIVSGKNLANFLKIPGNGLCRWKAAPLQATWDFPMITVALMLEPNKKS
ncbi:DUF2207 domain-containing protein [Neobacillus sp. PS3-34]|uniref:DUF2207 domain-containing protein n=1 Tax=Neobacillus sp. PS3-34 TaxID=3070678 RepID=UPI0027E21722|nr:DUF2207 domain-containing protein [Neobacillus sp. PS3-34]WML46797.1 DUF2207 domain-containing protein [Neobacillus sp. PS3-34]